MNEERLVGLSLFNIHRHRNIQVDETVDIFDGKRIKVYKRYCVSSSLNKNLLGLLLDFFYNFVASYFKILYSSYRTTKMFPAYATGYNF